MGLWGAAQAIAFGLGVMLGAGAGASDLARWLLGSPAAAYASVFAFEAILFVFAALLAARVGAPATAGVDPFRRKAYALAEPATAMGPPR